MSDDLVAFLAARLDEEHYLAHKFVYVDGGEWTADELARLWWFSEPPKSRSAADPIIQHAARYNPARALREVAAKRARLERYLAAAAEVELFPHGANVMVRDALLTEVREDAAVHSDHPGYRPEWRP